MAKPSNLLEEKGKDKFSAVCYLYLSMMKPHFGFTDNLTVDIMV